MKPMHRDATDNLNENMLENFLIKMYQCENAAARCARIIKPCEMMYEWNELFKFYELCDCDRSYVLLFLEGAI